MRKLTATALTAVVGMSLTACGGNPFSSVDPWDITTQAGKQEVTCDNVVDVRNALSKLVNDNTDDAVDQLAEWGFAPKEGMDVSAWNVESTKAYTRTESYLDRVENSEDCGGAGASASPSPEATATPAPAGLNERKLARAFAREMSDLGFKSGQASVGKVDWDKNPVDRRRGAFGGRIESQKELTRFLNSDTKEGRAARRHVLNAVPTSERERVLDGHNYVPVQYNVDIQYAGNGIWQGGKLKRGGKMVTKAGDVFWVYVTSDYDIVWDASNRADCANPGVLKPPSPHKPPPGKKTPPKPKEPPKTPPGGGGCEPGECPPPLTPKSSNPDDYTVPAGIPKAKVRKPADSRPPKVKTSQPSGGGHVEKPTKKPGSSTGVTAPGAAPAPSGPRDTGPREGGSGSSGGGSTGGGNSGGGGGGSDSGGNSGGGSTDPGPPNEGDPGGF